MSIRKDETFNNLNAHSVHSNYRCRNVMYGPTVVTSGESLYMNYKGTYKFTAITGITVGSVNFNINNPFVKTGDNVNVSIIDIDGSDNVTDISVDSIVVTNGNIYIEYSGTIGTPLTITQIITVSV